MLEVQKFIKEHGIEELQKQFAIVVTDYPDRIVLNYNQIESPRFVTLVDECRALILRKETWDVMAMSFLRFYNLGEGVDPKYGIETQRIAASVAHNQIVSTFDITKSKIMNKLDGSLLSLYHDGEKWCVSTRKLAFAEGQTNLGRTFAEVFWDAAKKTKLNEFISRDIAKGYTYVFELTSPENRIVTPYTSPNITLLTVRNNSEEADYHELGFNRVDQIALEMNVDRPQDFSAVTMQEVIDLVKKFPTMEEGVVLTLENPNGSHWRVKCKNPQYVAIAHMRENGNISPKNILHLVITNEDHEYLKYFDCDKPYFDFVREEYNQIVNRISVIWEEHKNIEVQKDFALAIMAKTTYSFENGVIFTLRKAKGMKTILQALEELGAKKIVDGISLKQKFIDKFHVVVEEDEK